MKPLVICHMASSLDGRTVPSRWAPSGTHDAAAYDRLHALLGGGSWMVGRTTGQEFAERDGYPGSFDAAIPREPWLPCRDARSYAIVVDAYGKIAWGRSEIGGDPIVVVMTESVDDRHLAGLRADGVGYLFAGREELDLALCLDSLKTELAIGRLLLEGGGTINGAFLRAGLIDELSLILEPAIDGRAGAPAIFEGMPDVGAPGIASLALTDHELLANGALWLRYRIGTG